MPRQHLRALFRDSSADELSQGQLRGKDLLEEAEEEEPPVENCILKVKVEKRTGRICSFMSELKFRTPSVKINRSLFSKSKNAIVANPPSNAEAGCRSWTGRSQNLKIQKETSALEGAKCNNCPGWFEAFWGQIFVISDRLILTQSVRVVKGICLHHYPSKLYWPALTRRGCEKRM